MDDTLLNDHIDTLLNDYIESYYAIFFPKMSKEANFD